MSRSITFSLYVSFVLYKRLISLRLICFAIQNLVEAEMSYFAIQYFPFYMMENSFVFCSATDWCFSIFVVEIRLPITGLKLDIDLTLTLTLTLILNLLPPSPPVDSIWAVMLVWRLREKIIRTAPCCVVYDSCAQWYAHRCEQFLQFSGLGFIMLGSFHCV